MTLEEIKKLSDKDLGINIANLLGKLTRDCGFWCLDMNDHYVNCEDLPTDLAVCSAVEEIVIEKVGAKKYCQKLIVNLLDLIAVTEGNAEIELTFEQIKKIVTATARERAEAFFLALQDLS